MLTKFKKRINDVPEKYAGKFSTEIRELKTLTRHLFPDIRQAEREFQKVQKKMVIENQRYLDLLLHYDRLKAAANLIRKAGLLEDKTFYGTLVGNDFEVNKTEFTRTKHKLDTKKGPGTTKGDLIHHRNSLFIAKRQLNSLQCKNDIFTSLTDKQIEKYLKLSSRYVFLENQIIKQATLQKTIEEIIIQLQKNFAKTQRGRKILVAKLFGQYLVFIKDIHEVTKLNLTEVTTFNNLRNVLRKFDNSVMRDHTNRKVLVHKLFELKDEFRHGVDVQNRVDEQRRKNSLLKSKKSRTTSKILKHLSKPNVSIFELKNLQFEICVGLVEHLTQIILEALETSSVYTM